MTEEKNNIDLHICPHIANNQNIAQCNAYAQIHHLESFLHMPVKVQPIEFSNSNLRDPYKIIYRTKDIDTSLCPSSKAPVFSAMLQ